MNHIKWFIGFSFFIGVIFIIYGWTQSLDFGARVDKYNTIFIVRTVRSYTFLIGGFVLLFVGGALSVIRLQLRKLEDFIQEERK